jgi:hypothetical protein
MSINSASFVEKLKANKAPLITASAITALAGTSYLLDNHLEGEDDYHKIHVTEAITGGQLQEHILFISTKLQTNLNTILIY